MQFVKRPRKAQMEGAYLKRKEGTLQKKKGGGGEGLKGTTEEERRKKS